MSSTTVSSPVSISSPVSGAGMSTAPSGRGPSPGGRNWGSGPSTSAAGGHGYHTHGGFTGQWATSSPHVHHYPHHGHHTVPTIYQPHSASHQHGTAMEDDKEVVQNARAALDWLERGDTYT